MWPSTASRFAREGADPHDVLIEHVSGLRSYSRTSANPLEMADVIVHESAQPAASRKQKSSPKVAAHDGANSRAKTLNLSSSPPAATDVATLSAPIGFAPIGIAVCTT